MYCNRRGVGWGVPFFPLFWSLVFGPELRTVHTRRPTQNMYLIPREAPVRWGAENTHDGLPKDAIPDGDERLLPGERAALSAKQD
jgi:hypothetical protein